MNCGFSHAENRNNVHTDMNATFMLINRRVVWSYTAKEDQHRNVHQLVKVSLRLITVIIILIRYEIICLLIIFSARKGCSSKEQH